LSLTMVSDRPCRRLAAAGLAAIQPAAIQLHAAANIYPFANNIQLREIVQAFINMTEIIKWQIYNIYRLRKPRMGYKGRWVVFAVGWGNCLLI
jgi:hypothetical protein